MNTRPSSDSIRRTTSKAWWTSSASTTSAPRARHSRTRAGLAPAVITTLAEQPTWRAAKATAMAWLPALTAVTPRAISSGVSARALSSAPRALNVPEY